MANHEAIFRKEKFSPDNQYSSTHWKNRVNSVEIQSSANFLSMNSAGQISISSSSSLSNENPSSTIVTGETLKDYVVSTQSSTCVPCRVNVSSKSDISSETGPLVYGGSSGLESVKSEGRQKHMTESSCSNSIPSKESNSLAVDFSRKCERLGSSYLEIVDQEFMKQQLFSNPQHQPKAPHPPGLYELSGLNHGDKSTESISALPAKFHPDLFDLNEDSKESKSHVQSTCETGNPFNVIRVLAKPGVPLNVPTTCQKLESEMSWKGSAATSAFRSTNLKVQASQGDSTPTISKGLTGFDLNVASAEDDAESKLHLGVGRTLDTCLKVDCIKAERLDFDLNFVGDMHQGASLPTTLMKTGTIDSNLNEGSSSVDKCDDGHRKNIPTGHIAKIPFNPHGASFATNSGGHGANVIRPAYWSDFSNIQLYSQSQMQPFLMTSPNPPRPVEQFQKVVQLHPKLPYIIPSLPQNYPPNGPFFVCPNGLVSSNMHYSTPVQYSADPQVHAAFPQRISHTMVPSVSGGPHFMQMVHGNARNQNEVASIRPCTDVSRGNSEFNLSQRDTRQYFPPPKCSSVEEQMRVPSRRTEPDGAAFPQRISHTRAPSVSGGPYLMQMVHGHGRSQNEVANFNPCSGNQRNPQQYFPPPKRSSIEEKTRMSPKRREPEGGHDTCELRTRQLTSWN